jgi:site-specific recombinase XerC
MILQEVGSEPAGIADRSGPHALRHTFASHALHARPNLRAVQAQVADLPANRCHVAS